jgi:hypothetical protein
MDKEVLREKIINEIDNQSTDLSEQDYRDLLEDIIQDCKDRINAFDETH